MHVSYDELLSSEFFIDIDVGLPQHMSIKVWSGRLFGFIAMGWQVKSGNEVPLIRVVCIRYNR
jgi:hypothetical protein